MAMKLSVPKRHIKVIVLPQRKMFQLLLYNFGGHILSYTYGPFKLFPYAKPWALLRETTLQHDMARNICFNFRLEEG